MGKDLLFVCGYLYVSWVLFEILFFSWYWRTFGKAIDMIHHLLFAATGLYFMTQPDVTAFYAGALMTMEASTPWLNLYLAFRHSTKGFLATLGKAAGIFYLITMSIFRVVLPSIILWQ